jgi:hypothetical protein
MHACIQMFLRLSDFCCKKKGCQISNSMHVVASYDFWLVLSRNKLENKLGDLSLLKHGI